jgi:hypothetical protein
MHYQFNSNGNNNAKNNQVSNQEFEDHNNINIAMSLELAGLN